MKPSQERSPKDEAALQRELISRNKIKQEQNKEKTAQAEWSQPKPRCCQGGEDPGDRKGGGREDTKADEEQVLDPSDQGQAAARKA